MKSFYEWYRKHITGAIFGGLILGILTGLFLAGRFNVVLTATSVLGSIYMSALNMMIFPLVFCSIVMGIASIGSAKTTGTESSIWITEIRRSCIIGENCRQDSWKSKELSGIRWRKRYRL